MNIKHVIEKFEMKKEIKSLKFNFNFANLNSFILLGMILIMITFVILWYSYHSAPKIDYSKLSESELRYAQGLIEKINPAYLNTSKSIKFVTDYKDVPGNEHKDIRGIIYIGRNRVSSKDIIILLTFDESEDLNTICHELLHSIVYNINEEYLVKDIADKGVCLK